jgi:hypothetical protein
MKPSNCGKSVINSHPQSLIKHIQASCNSLSMKLGCAIAQHNQPITQNGEFVECVSPINNQYVMDKTC